MYGFGYKYTASGPVGGVVSQSPVISDIVISLITDTAFRVTCTIDPKGTLTPVLHFGETVAYGDTLNGTEISTAGSVVFNVTGLASWTDYYCKVVAGATELAYVTAITTLPVAQFSTLLAALTGDDPDLQVQKSQNKFIKTVVDAGIWAKLSALVIANGGMKTSSDSLIWWNNPARTGSLSPTAPTFIENEGFTGNGTSSYVLTGFNPVADGGTLFIQNNASYGYFFNNNRIATGNVQNGVFNSSNQGNIFSAVRTDGILRSINSTSSSITVTPIGTNHLFSVTRTGTTVTEYIDKTKIADRTIASAAMVSGVISALARNGLPTFYGFGADTFGLFYAGAYLTEAEIGTLYDAYMLMLEENLADFEYSADGETIDVAKVTLTNPDATYARFTQNNGLIIDSLFAGTSTFINNRVTLIDKRRSGEWMFSMADINLNTGGYSVEIGVKTDDNLNRIVLKRATATGAFTFYIYQNNVAVYSELTTIDDFAILKLTISRSGVIKLFVWNNDTWSQATTTQTFTIGPVRLFVATGGGSGRRTVIKDIKISNNSIVSPSISTIAIDPRTYGAVADGVTDNSVAINAALAAGNIILQNGTFLFSDSIKIPSNRTVYGKNCKLKKADASYDNFFRNADQTGGNTNINILSLGNMVLDGNAVNNDDDYATYGYSNGNPTAYRYLGISIYNCTNVEIDGLLISDYMHWFGFVQKSSAVEIHHIHFGYKTVTVNQDGIDIGCGCSNINFHHFSGRTRDDLTCINTSPDAGLAVAEAGYDTGNVSNIQFNDIDSWSTQSGSLLSMLNESTVTVSVINANRLKMQAGRSLFWTYEVAGGGGPANDFVIDDVVVATNSNANLCVLNSEISDVVITNLTNNSGKGLISRAVGIVGASFYINGNLV